jgi:ABC-2 type transport system ATP-binding protein
MDIAVVELNKRYGLAKALDDVTLQIGSGETVALLGTNGAGKTTLLQCLAGICIPNSGTILFDGIAFKREDLDLRRRFHFLADFPAIFPESLVVNHIAMTVSLYRDDGPADLDRIVELMKSFDILELAETPIGKLSRGQTYKAALCGLIIADPELWLMDEPFASGMDPQGLFTFRREAQAAVKRGRTIIYSTQILDVVERFSDRVCVLHQGQVRAFDDLNQIKTSEGESGLEAIFNDLRSEG